MNRRRTPVSWRTRLRACGVRGMSVLALLVAVTLAGCSAAISPQVIDDAQTAARVKTALVNDPDLGSRTIEVRVSQGVASLSGRVASAEEAERAAALARGVSGVRAVQNNLQVGTDAAIVAAEPPRTEAATRDLDQELIDLRAPPGLVAVGLGISRTHPIEGAFASRVSVGPILKLGSGRGFAPHIGFSWFHADLASPTGSGAIAGRVRVRPLMGGVSYTHGPPNVSVTFSLVGGVAFNSLHVRDPGGGPMAVDVGNSFVWRPNVTVWRDLTYRTILNVSAGYVHTSFPVTFVDGGTLYRRTMNGSTVILSAGVAYRLF